MKPDFKNTFLLAFEAGHLAPPERGERWCFFNGQLLPPNEIFFSDAEADLIFEQGFRHDYLALEKAGFQATPSMEKDTKFDGAVVFAGRSRDINEQNILRALETVKAGGIVLVAGAKTSGIGSLRKWLKRFVETEESLSKHHAVCFWCRKPHQFEIKARDESFGAGLFSRGEPDKGSELLARFFTNKVKGKVADLGAGWGYLTEQLLTQSGNVESIDLYEADWQALETARTHLREKSTIPLIFHWVDIPSEFRKKPFEWIIMNPPFHHGLHGSRASDPGLGKAFIQTAASSLVQGGKLLMVANRNLPYEEILQKAFRRFETLADEAGYKVIEATK